jgi:glycosyltransferase involved in cell wall biosynthesis
MLIGIDANEGNVEKKVGISEYVFELLHEFQKLSHSARTFEIYLKSIPSKDFPEKNSNWKYTVFGPSKFWTQFALPLKLYTQKDKPNVFFSPAHYAPRFSPIPSVISIMDLAFFHFPELFTKRDLYQLHSWTRYSILNASQVLTISNATKSDIIKLYNIPKERVTVIYPGIKNHETKGTFSMKELQEKYTISSNFILFIGTLQPRKNIERAIEAFSLVKKTSSRDLQFVIIGKKGWKFEDILNAPAKYDVEKDVKFLDFVPDSELPTFYKNAKLFLFPSLYEGFGLPVLEAMGFGCPVLTSNVSSLPEAGGDAAHYVDPNDSQAIADGIKKIIEDSAYRKSLIAKGSIQVKKFSWEKAAKETLSVLEEVGSAKS